MDLRTNGEYLNKSNEFGDNIFTFELPDDYLHLLNCKAQISGSNVTNNRCGSSITNKTTAVAFNSTTDGFNFALDTGLKEYKIILDSYAGHLSYGTCNKLISDNIFVKCVGSLGEEITIK